MNNTPSTELSSRPGIEFNFCSLKRPGEEPQYKRINVPVGPEVKGSKPRVIDITEEGTVKSPVISESSTISSRVHSTVGKEIKPENRKAEETIFSQPPEIEGQKTAKRAQDKSPTRIKQTPNDFKGQVIDELESLDFKKSKKTIEELLESLCARIVDNDDISEQFMKNLGLK